MFYTICGGEKIMKDKVSKTAPVQAATNETGNKSIIGQFSGKCCDTNVVNSNGMFLGEKLFKNVIESQEYKDAIANRWYIGYLGHPSDEMGIDPQFNDLNMCIIMTSMKIESNGDIYGEFDLIDTPVGRIVKTLIDAGVKFGISIRGAGDVDEANGGEVNPDTFIFRGFDLVRFPAYSDCIPTFTEIAASTDIEKQQKYKAVCASIKTNIQDITSAETLTALQENFNEHSDEYKLLEERKSELIGDASDEEVLEECTECEDKDLVIEVLQKKLAAMTKLYLEQFNANHELSKANDQLLIENSTMLKASNRKFESFKKLMSSQTSRLTASLDKTSDKLELVTAANNRLKNTMHDKVLANQKLEDENKKLVKANTELKSDNQRLIKANSALRTDNKQLVKANTDLESVNHKINSKLDTEVQNNLIYKRRIDANVQKLDKNAKTISDLNAKYKTVMAGKTSYDQKISDLESKIDALNQEIESNTKTIEEYQQAYANLCANTIGTHLSNIPVTASTSVQELQEYIYGSTNTSDVAVAPVIESPEVIDIDIDDNSEYSSSNVVIV